MAAPIESQLDRLSEDILVQILGYLPSIDLCNVSRTNSKFQRLCHDRCLVRYSNFQGAYRLTDDLLRHYLSNASLHIESLNLNHCYWISGRVLESGIVCCKNVSNLQILQCNVTVKRLCRIMENLKKLKTLAFTLQDIRDFLSELRSSQGAQSTIAGLRVICLHFKHLLEFSASISMHFLSQPSFFEYCCDLEELHVLGSPSSSRGMPRYLLQPQIHNKDSLKNLKVLCLNDAIDPAARMFFFGTLFEVCKLNLSFKTLLQPTSNLQQLQEKPHFVKCLQRIDKLQHLDLSRAVFELPNTIFRLDQAKSLQFLNLADNCRIQSSSLKVIAEHCPQLVSINLQNCHNILQKKEGEEAVADVTGLQTLLVSCRCLRHINLSGIHVHDKNNACLWQLISLNTEWKSVSISPCCLTHNVETEAASTSRKRSLIEEYSATFKKQRTGVSSFTAQEACTSRETTPVEIEVAPSGLAQLVSLCPNLEELELIGAGFRSAFNKYFGVLPGTFTFRACMMATKVRDCDLMCIARWDKLRYLQLSGMPGIHQGQCLLQIAKGCVNLEQLYISHLGLSGNCQYIRSLFEAFDHFKKLKDLRLEQPYLKLDAVFFSSCQKCQSLERLCILSKNATSIDVAAVGEFVANMPSLVALQLFTGANLNTCKSLQTSLTRRFDKIRPALTVCIHPLLHEELSKITCSIPIVNVALVLGTRVVKMRAAVVKRQNECLSRTLVHADLSDMFGDEKKLTKFFNDDQQLSLFTKLSFSPTQFLKDVQAKRSVTEHSRSSKRRPDNEDSPTCAQGPLKCRDLSPNTQGALNKDLTMRTTKQVLKDLTSEEISYRTPKKRQAKTCQRGLPNKCSRISQVKRSLTEHSRSAKQRPVNEDPPTSAQGPLEQSMISSIFQ